MGQGLPCMCGQKLPAEGFRLPGPQQLNDCCHPLRLMTPPWHPSAPCHLRSNLGATVPNKPPTFSYNQEPHEISCVLIDVSRSDSTSWVSTDAQGYSSHCVLKSSTLKTEKSIYSVIFTQWHLTSSSLCFSCNPQALRVTADGPSLLLWRLRWQTSGQPFWTLFLLKYNISWYKSQKITLMPEAPCPFLSSLTGSPA